MFENLSIEDVEKGIDNMLRVVVNETGASQSTANFLLSVIGKQEFDILEFMSKVDNTLYMTAMQILFLLREHYFSIVEVLKNKTSSNLKLLIRVSKI